MIYGNKDCLQKIHFAEEVINHFKSHRQSTGPEVGGQLFGRYVDGKVYIEKATGPYPEDKKLRFSFLPSRSKERKDINEHFRSGLHYVGDWHTHPEKFPKPSLTDLTSMRDCFVKSRHQHGAFLMVIVGNGIGPEWLSLSLHNEKSHIFLGEELPDPKTRD